MYPINFANDWSQTADLWNRKRLLYQLSHNHWIEIQNCYQLKNVKMPSQPFTAAATKSTVERRIASTTFLTWGRRQAQRRRYRGRHENRWNDSSVAAAEG